MNGCGGGIEWIREAEGINVITKQMQIRIIDRGRCGDKNCACMIEVAVRPAHFVVFTIALIYLSHFHCRELRTVFVPSSTVLLGVQQACEQDSIVWCKLVKYELAAYLQRLGDLEGQGW